MATFHELSMNYVWSIYEASVKHLILTTVKKIIHFCLSLINVQRLFIFVHINIIQPALLFKIN